MAQTKARHIATFGVSFSFALLGGCAQLGALSDSVWGGTKRITHAASSQISSLLRPAPQQVEKFEHGPATNSSAVNPDFVADFMQKYASPAVESPTNITRYAMMRTVENGVSVYRPGASNGHVIRMPAPRAPSAAARIPELRPAYDAYAQPSYKSPEPNAAHEGEGLAGAPSIETQAPDLSSDLSYVKIGGGSDMADWEACQRDTGDFIITNGERYRIDPAFDRCMRTKGYLPESEAMTVLEKRAKL